MCRRDEEPMGIVECSCCGGEGEIVAGVHPGNWYEPPCEIMGRCPECDGRGGVEGLPELIDEFDLDEMTPPVSAYEPPVSSDQIAA